MCICSSQTASFSACFTRSARVIQAVSEASRACTEHSDRVELLLRENNLLTKQNAELDKEVCRLNADNEEMARRLLDTTQQYSNACSQLKNKDSEASDMSEQCAAHRVLTVLMHSKLAT